jgi:hypothetical protein
MRGVQQGSHLQQVQMAPLLYTTYPFVYRPKVQSVQPIFLPVPAGEAAGKLVP